MKLGLIAMSGVRAYNKKLTELGLTLPGFIERNKVIASLPSLGLLTLAGLTPEDVEITYVDVPNGDEFEKLPAVDLVAISSFSAQIKEAYRLADRFRDQGTQVVLGGLHVTALPLEAARHADSVVIGEGEVSWPQVIADAKRGALKPLYDGRSTPFDFKNAPMPRFDLLDFQKYNRITVQTQRGCPFNCSFCASSIRLAPRYKVKPVEKVIEEIRAIKSLWDRPFIEFADDNTFVNKRHSKELVKAIARENVRWFTESDISVAYDDELLDLLADSGCAQILIGLESPVQSILKDVELKSNWKARQLETYKQSSDRIQSRGITVNGCFVLGLDHTTLETFDDVFDFVRETGLYEVQVTVQTPFPGTPLYEQLHSEGRLLKPEAWELCTLFDVNFTPNPLTVKELEESFCELVEKLYSESFTNERRSRFRSRLRETRRIKEKELKRSTPP